MMGDNYRWDYVPARDVGIDALLMDSDYLKRDRQGRRVRKTLKRLDDVLQYI